MKHKELTYRIIGCAMEVHKQIKVLETWAEKLVGMGLKIIGRKEIKRQLMYGNQDLMIHKVKV